jgi:hypothetical protein
MPAACTSQPSAPIAWRIFARCREAHCIITGLGWGVLAIVAFVAALMRLDWFGPIWNAFLIVFVVGHGFELIWARARHTHVLRT